MKTRQQKAETGASCRVPGAGRKTAFSGIRLTARGGLLAARGLLLCAFCLLPAAPPVRAEGSFAQEGKSQVIVPMQSGAFVLFSTEAVPAGAPEVAAGFIESEETPNHLHRVFVDRKGRLFFGYELVVEPVPGAREFRVSVRPLSDAYVQQLLARAPFAGHRLHPNYNPAAFDARPQLVGDGDTFALDVLHNPRTGAKITDVVTVSFSDPRLRAAPESASPPRDFTREDMQMRVTGYRLVVDGEQVSRSTIGCAGSLVWFSLSGRGRFVFSLVERPGYDFRKAGTVSHNKISFEWGGSRYEWISSLPVVEGGGNWNLWVWHDPDYSYDLFDGEAEAGGAQGGAESGARRNGQRTRTALAQPGGAAPRAAARRLRVAIGAAPRMELLLPQKARDK